MPDRAYTVKELDALREVVDCKWMWGKYDYRLLSDRMGRTVGTNERMKAVEERVRTHMLAGHTAQDLLDSER